METITSGQLNTLAQQFLDMGNALQGYRENNPGIDDEENANLEDAANQLLTRAGDLATLAVIQSGTEAANAVTKLISVNSEINDTLKQLSDVQKAIDIATAAVNVVASVISLNPGDIISSTGGLLNTCGLSL